MIVDLLTALGWIGIYSVFDILLVENLFKPTNIYAQPGYDPGPYADMYHVALWALLFPATTLTAFGLSRKSLYSFLLFLGGWEDILYFWLQLKSVPQEIEWLPFTPTDVHLYARALASLGISLGVDDEVQKTVQDLARQIATIQPRAAMS